MEETLQKLLESLPVLIADIATIKRMVEDISSDSLDLYKKNLSDFLDEMSSDEVTSIAEAIADLVANKEVER